MKNWLRQREAHISNALRRASYQKIGETSSDRADNHNVKARMETGNAQQDHSSNSF